MTGSLEVFTWHKVERASLSSHTTKLQDLLLVLALVVAISSVSTETVPEVDPLGRPLEDCLSFVFCNGGGYSV